jgi:hypothetical protein
LPEVLFVQQPGPPPLFRLEDEREAAEIGPLFVTLCRLTPPERRH